MKINISKISNNINIQTKTRDLRENKIKFSSFVDPVTQGIMKNVKNPIDQEEDLRFWNEVKDAGIKYCKGEEMTYEDFKELKEITVGFPPPSAPGYIRKAYREYMNKLPKNKRDEIQGILSFTYAECINRKGIKPSSFGAILDLMKQHLGEIGDKNTDFDFIRKCLNDFSDFDKESKADERMKQMLI